MGKSMKVGGGGRFQSLKERLAKEKGVRDPAAAAAGRRKYGSGRMARMAAAGRHRRLAKEKL